MKTYLYKPLLAAMIFAMVPLAHAQISVSVGIELPPPELPVYNQPVIPGDGYIWTPGYWSWNPNENDYYWVPGTWVNAPYVGALWTPGYWGHDGNNYSWNRGYWGDHIGYYGGINYGHGYAGVGYQGGYWDRGSFSYNRTVNNVSNVHVTNVYSSRVTNVQNSHVSYNGGRGGVQMSASKNEQIINSMPHNQATSRQAEHETQAHTLQDQRMSVNHGAPKVAATPEPGAYNAANVEHTRAERAEPAQRQQQPQARQPQPQRDNQPQARQAQPQRDNQPQYRQAQPQRENQPQPQHDNQPQQRQAQPQHDNQPQQRPAQAQHENRPAGHEEEHKER